MNDRKTMKVCPGCGKRKRIRTDRTYCSMTCAQRHRAAEARAETSTLVFGDVHIPNHDPKAVELLLRWAGDFKPDRIIINGDLLDCYPISRWAQPGIPGPGLAAEIAQGRGFLESLRGAAPRAAITYIEGNHEFRFRAYLANEAPQIIGLEHNVTVPDQLHFAEHCIEYVPCPGHRWFSTHVEACPGVMVGHFAKTSVHAAYAAKGLVERYGTTLITGHNHSAGMHHRTLAGGPVWAYEGGCLCELQPPYMEPSNWAHAFHVVHYRADERPIIEPVIIEGHRFYYGGRRFAA